MQHSIRATKILTNSSWHDIIVFACGLNIFGYNFHSSICDSQPPYLRSYLEHQIELFVFPIFFIGFSVMECIIKWHQKKQSLFNFSPSYTIPRNSFKIWHRNGNKINGIQKLESFFLSPFILKISLICGLFLHIWLLAIMKKC